MEVNAFVVQGPSGVVVVDGMLTVSDGRRVRRAVDQLRQPLAGVVLTHPHPDHYAGLAYIVLDDDVTIVATAAVDTVIRRDDDTKDKIVGPMIGDEWPTVLDRLEKSLPSSVNLYVGHGPPGGRELLRNQRRYIEAFLAAVGQHTDAIAAGNHEPVLVAMRSVLPTEDLMFLPDLSIRPVWEALTSPVEEPRSA